MTDPQASAGPLAPVPEGVTGVEFEQGLGLV